MQQWVPGDSPYFLTQYWCLLIIISSWKFWNPGHVRKIMKVKWAKWIMFSQHKALWYNQWHECQNRNVAKNLPCASICVKLTVILYQDVDIYYVWSFCMYRWLLPIEHVTLVVITGTTFHVPYLQVNSLHLIRRSGTRRWNLRMPDLQISCSDLATW